MADVRFTAIPPKSTVSGNSKVAASKMGKGLVGSQKISQNYVQKWNLDVVPGTPNVIYVFLKN